MLENISDITSAELLGTAHQMKAEGYRFITASCVDLGDGTVDLLYHFDRGYQLRQFRLTINREDEVPSISPVYLCAFLVENEIGELFGITITNMAVDYGGRLLLAAGAPTNPMACGGQITIERR